MADSYVCSGATMRCTMGEMDARLTVLPIRTVFLCGKPMANISDHTSMVNLAPFGRCRSLGYPATASATAAHHGVLTPMPCMHNTPMPWMNGKNDYLIKGQPALLKSCKCTCIWGGTISITNDGQTDIGSADLSRENRLSSDQLSKGAEQTKEISSEGILDGIQLALDAAGFIPGVGAIPDLMNASISALRGDWVSAGFSLLAAVPVIGDIAAGAKIAKRGCNIAKMAKKSVSRNVNLSPQRLLEKGMSEAEAKAFRRGVINERRKVAKKFYQENTNWTNKDIESHLQGIDFTKPIKVDKIPKGSTVYQYRKWSEKTGKYEPGKYFTLNPKATPGELGIADTFSIYVTNAPKGSPQQLGLPFQRIKFSGVVTEEVPCLRSTAKKIEDTWSMTGQNIVTKGGGEQLFIPNNGFASKMIKIENHV